MPRKTKKLADYLPDHETKTIYECPKCGYQREIDNFDHDNKKYIGCKCKSKIKISMENFVGQTTIYRHTGLE